METAKSIADTGPRWPSPDELEKAVLAKCVYRENPHENGARCGAVTAAHGKPHAVAPEICKICQANGAPDLSANPFLKGLACHLAFDDVVAGPRATEAKAPTDIELDASLGLIRQLRGDTVARGFVDALVYHESVTPEKGAELAATLTLETAK